MFPDDDIRVVIIGGGATGVLLACHLLRDPHGRVQVTIIEKSPMPDWGSPTRTRNPQHLLNVRASNMSAFPDEPEHFWHWLKAGRAMPGWTATTRSVRAARRLWPLSHDLLQTHRVGCAPGQALHVLHGECVSLRPTRLGVEIKLTDGSSVFGHIAVLATGNEAPPNAYGPCGASPWQEPQQAGVAPDDAVLIVGSGLTMVDYVLSLLRAQHRGPITAMSRRGLLPQRHRAVTPLMIDAADVPFGTDISYCLRWLRRLAARDDGLMPDHDWRAVIDALRPFTRELWQSWPDGAKRRFLRHARAFWDVHRHRTAPEIDTRLRAAMASGQVKVIAGKVANITIQPNGGAKVSYRRRHCGEMELMRVARIVTCTGVGVAPRDSTNPVLQNLSSKA